VEKKPYTYLEAISLCLIVSVITATIPLFAIPLFAGAGYLSFLLFIVAELFSTIGVSIGYFTKKREWVLFGALSGASFAFVLFSFITIATGLILTQIGSD